MLERHIKLQYDHLNQATWKKIDQWKRPLNTKDIHIIIIALRGIHLYVHHDKDSYIKVLNKELFNIVVFPNNRKCLHEKRTHFPKEWNFMIGNSNMAAVTLCKIALLFTLTARKASLPDVIHILWIFQSKTLLHVKS